MNHRLCSIALAICVSFGATQAAAQSPDPPDQEETVDLFGFGLPQNERLKISGLLMAAWSHDGMQAQLGFEKQARVGQATITFSGRVNDRVRYLDPKRLWQFLVSGEFWTDSSGRAQKRLVGVLETALSEKLLSHGECVDGVTAERLASDFVPACCLFGSIARRRDAL